MQATKRGGGEKRWCCALTNNIGTEKAGLFREKEKGGREKKFRPSGEKMGFTVFSLNILETCEKSDQCFRRRTIVVISRKHFSRRGEKTQKIAENWVQDERMQRIGRYKVGNESGHHKNGTNTPMEERLS